ncbi:MAG: exodeoxyribonuclease VII small subunit [Bacteroidota bacterium]
MASEKMTYESAFEELNTIVSAIEDDSITVDELASKVERAASLIKFCSDKLRSTEQAVDKIIRQMDDPGPKSDESKSDLPF